MKKEDMFDILAEIDEERITEAEMKKMNNNRAWVKLGTLAACLAVAVAISIPYFGSNKLPKNNKDVIMGSDTEDKDSSLNSQQIKETDDKKINTFYVTTEEAQNDKIIINDLGDIVIRSEQPEMTSYSGKIPESVWNAILTEFEKACGISYYDFIAKMPEGYGFPLFYSVDGYKDHELTDEMKIHDYVFKFRDGDVIIALSSEEKTKYGNCAYLYEKNKDHTEKSIVNNVEVYIYKTSEAVYISFTSNKCYYDISIYSDITQEEIKTLLYALIANKSDPSIEAPSDTDGSYAEAVNTDILSEASQNIFCGSYLDENGKYVILVTETASDPDKSQLLAEIGRTSENTTFKTAKYTMKYLTELQEKISDAMSNNELPFVMSSGVYDDKNRIIVTVNTKDEAEYSKLYAFDTIGGAIEAEYSEESFTTLTEDLQAILPNDILPDKAIPESE